MKKKCERKHPKMQESKKIKFVNGERKKTGIRRQMKRESEERKKFSIERMRVIN